MTDCACNWTPIQPSNPLFFGFFLNSTRRSWGQRFGRSRLREIDRDNRWVRKGRLPMRNPRKETQFATTKLNFIYNLRKTKKMGSDNFSSKSFRTKTDEGRDENITLDGPIAWLDDSARSSKSNQRGRLDEKMEEFGFFCRWRNIRKYDNYQMKTDGWLRCIKYVAATILVPVSGCGAKKNTQEMRLAEQTVQVLSKHSNYIWGFGVRFRIKQGWITGHIKSSQLREKAVIRRSIENWVVIVQK